MQGHVPDKEYSWRGVIEFLQNQKVHSQIVKQEWNIERDTLAELLQEKDRIISVLQTENKELLTRVQMLEYALRQERVKFSKCIEGHHRVNSDVVSNIIHNQTQLYKSQVKQLSKNIEDDVEKTVKAQMVHRPSQSYGGQTGVAYIENLKRYQESQKITESPKNVGKVRVWAENDAQWKEPDTLSKTKAVSGKKLLSPKLTMKSHVDGVRGLHFLNSEAVLASASEDCMIKLWDLRYINNETEICDPYFTLRGHRGPVLTITGGYGWGGTNINESLIYSAGVEGVIKVWDVPFPELIDNDVGSDGKNYCLGT